MSTFRGIIAFSLFIIMTNVILAGLISLGIGIWLGTLAQKIFKQKAEEEKQLAAERKLLEASSKAKDVLLEAKNEASKIQEEAKKEEHEKRQQLEKIEERLVKKEEALDQKTEASEKFKEELEQKITAVKELKVEIQTIYEQQKQQLEKVAALSQAEARELLLKKVEEETKADLVLQIKKAEEEMRKTAQEKAKWIIAEAMQKYAAETASESTVTLVSLPAEDMKGRIIGREGRNINAFEEATGIDVIIDDTPGSIVISGFDIIRRYVAKIALERLLADGRIHPARIEETVGKVKEEVNALIKELGEKAVYETGVGGLHPNLVKILGRLKFRTSGGQNALKHSMEVSFLAAHLAAEIGADVNICRKAGLLHDIGKAVDHEVQGHHAAIGRDILKKFAIDEKVIHCVAAHTGDLEEAQSVEAMVIQTANIISNTRPGATKENLDNFIKRLEELETFVQEIPGVQKAYAIQAGREVRVIANPEEIDDLQTIKLTHEIARKIEHDLQYPGQIKVHVIREKRAEAFAM